MDIGVHMHTHTVTSGISKINVVTPVRNLGKPLNFFLVPPTSYLSLGSIATASKTPLTLICPHFIATVQFKHRHLCLTCLSSQSSSWICVQPILCSGLQSTLPKTEIRLGHSINPSTAPLSTKKSLTAFDQYPGITPESQIQF